MKIIYKYQVPMVEEPVISMPVGAKVLSFGAQYEQLFIWALVDSDRKSLAAKRFLLATTGSVLNPRVTLMRLVGTATLSGGDYVAHLFEA